MRGIRLIVLDIDGTLLDDAKKLPEVNRRALLEAKAAGIDVAIASGRMIPTIEPIEEALGIDGIIIAYNGGKVVGPRAGDRRMLVHRPVPAAAAEKLIDFSRDSGHLLNFYLDDLLYAEDGSDRRRFMDTYSSRTGSRYNLVDLSTFRGKAPTKMILLADPPRREDLIVDLCSRHPEIDFARSDPEYIEITAKGVNKGSALVELTSRLGIDLSEVLAVGDAENDNEMLRTAGVGVAVANARESTKRSAKAVTSRTNNEGAVAEAVSRFALGREL